MLFYELIRIALGRQEAFSQTPSPAEWEALFCEAQSQTLSGVLYGGLCRLPAEQKPPRQILIDWHATAQMIICDNKRYNHDAVWLTKKWAKLGYPSVILKGQGNATLYPDPMLRIPGDIDIWLDGDMKSIVRYVRKLFPKVEVTRIEMDFPIRPNTPVEIHFAPSYLYDPFMNRRLQRYMREQLKNAKQIELPGEGVISIPGDEMNLVFQLSHIFRHLFFEGIGLRQLIDYDYLLCSVRDEATRRQAMSVIGQLGLKDFCGALMWVLSEVFHTPKELLLAQPDARRGRFLLSEVMRAGNFGQADDRVGNWAEMNRWERLTWGTKWSWRLMGQYPREVMWHPYYRISQYVWRLFNGYL